MLEDTHVQPQKLMPITLKRKKKVDGAELQTPFKKTVQKVSYLPFVCLMFFENLL